MQKTALKNGLSSKSESILKFAKNGHQANAIDFAKSSLCVKNGKCLRTCYKRFYNTLQLIYAKKGSKKQLIFERWEILKIAKNGHKAKFIDCAKSSLWVEN